MPLGGDRETMNGMKKKAERLKQERMLSADGLPRDARDCTEADWRDLHEAMEAVKRKVKARHECRKKP